MGIDLDCWVLGLGFRVGVRVLRCQALEFKDLGFKL